MLNYWDSLSLLMTSPCLSSPFSGYLWLCRHISHLQPVRKHLSAWGGLQSAVGVLASFGWPDRKQFLPSHSPHAHPPGPMTWDSLSIPCLRLIQTPNNRPEAPEPPSFAGCCCSVVQSCPALCDPMDCSMPGFPVLMDCSMPGFPVLHCHPELAQTHVHGVSDAIQSSRPLSSPSPLHLQEAKAKTKNVYQLTAQRHRPCFKISRYQTDYPSFNPGGWACVGRNFLLERDKQLLKSPILTYADANTFPPLQPFRASLSFPSSSKWPLVEGALARNHFFSFFF